MSNERRSRLVRGRVSAISKTETNNKKVQGFRIPNSANALGIALIFEFFELSEMPAPSKYAVWALLPQWAAPIFLSFLSLVSRRCPPLILSPVLWGMRPLPDFIPARFEAPLEPQLHTYIFPAPHVDALAYPAGGKPNGRAGTHRRNCGLCCTPCWTSRRASRFRSDFRGAPPWSASVRPTCGGSPIFLLLGQGGLHVCFCGPEVLLRPSGKLFPQHHH